MRRKARSASSFSRAGTTRCDSWIAGRRRSKTSCAGHATAVRGWRCLLGLDSSEVQSAGEISEEEAAAALETGDETAGDRDALEQGFDPQDPKQSPKAALELARRRREADVTAIVAAVDDYTEDLREPNRRFDEIDVLRLRAMIMIIAVAGWPGPADQSYKPSHVQVLPCHHPIRTDTWPRLIGRVLLPVFSGPDPALGRLVLDRGHDRLPDDCLETLACCMWSANAAAMATKLNPACAKLSPMLASLAARIPTFLGLSRAEMTAPAFADVIEGLDQRFGKRL